MLTLKQFACLFVEVMYVGARPLASNFYEEQLIHVLSLAKYTHKQDRPLQDDSVLLPTENRISHN